VPLADADLAARVASGFETLAVRAASLRALARRAADPGSRAALESALAAALGSWRSELRAEAREVLAALDPGRALAAIAGMGWSSRTRERQRAVALLARLATPGADALLARRLDELLAGELAPELALDVLEAARARGTEELRGRLAALDASLDPSDPLARHRAALRGGDAERGRAVFDGRGDCRRCHGLEGQGGGAGPALAGIAGERSREELLESLVDPQARLAEGFGPASAMPAMDRILSPRELRDVIEYLVSLD
jgi:quinoprotein glucose dehydrogenase